MKQLRMPLFVAILALTFSNCDKEENSKNTLVVNFQGLENLGPNYVYEGWVMINGSPTSTGTFTINDNGSLSEQEFDVPNLESATAFVLTIEPTNDPDPAPSSTKILAGNFEEDCAKLHLNHPAALNTNFANASGGFILATPTDDDASNEASGVWFLDNSSGAPAPGLNLPTLPAGWIYEGWAVINGQPVSTGTFSSATGADQAAPFSGAKNGPPFPGEDFLKNAPSGLTFPTNLTNGGVVVISVEPQPDNSTKPFALKPLVQPVAANAALHSFIEMGNMATNNPIEGRANRK